MIIYLAADHAGFDLKEKVRHFLANKGYTIEDCGAAQLNPDDDYPDFIQCAAEAVSRDPENIKAVIFGGSGQGEAMVANRYKGVRTAVWYGGNTDVIKLSREHNDANVLSIGSRFVKEDEAFAAIQLWLETSFSGEVRHQRRIAKF